ncbi:hypothetical protein PHJA_000139000 [Phtheirospermum japonicum]|uniref:Uncharacterized protein n=1 Tax=Phtheirospermum japonicum TaxID=374723 RepID=A0A830B072_9LAMI|nr:hypothetical protein PHJA_000139000 [Phtheirospermum japonicum]
MAVTKIGDWAFRAFTAGLGVATIYLTATFSFNVYRGLAWHSAQTVIKIVLFFFSCPPLDCMSSITGSEFFLKFLKNLELLYGEFCLLYLYIAKWG